MPDTRTNPGLDTISADRKFDAAIMPLVSVDPTIKANLSVGLPVDVQIAERDSLRQGRQFRVTADDPSCQTLSTGWDAAPKTACDGLPDIAL